MKLPNTTRGFAADIVLAIPMVVMRPSPEEIQSSVNKIVQSILKMFEAIPQWSHISQAQKQVCFFLLVKLLRFNVLKLISLSALYI